MQQTSSGRQAEQGDDVWTQGAQQGLAFVGRYRRQLTAGLSIALCLIVAVVVVVSRQRAAGRAASAAFARALAVLERPSDEERQAQARLRQQQEDEFVAADAAGGEAAEAADGADASPQPTAAERLAAQREQRREAERAADEEADRRGIPKFATARARDEAARVALQEVTTRWPKAEVSRLAALQTASMAQHLGDEAQATAILNGLFDSLADDDTLLPLVADRVAEARRRSGNVDGAIAALARIAGSEHRFLADEAALTQAYLLADAGQVQAAQAALEDMALKFPDSPLQDEMRAELAALPVASAAAQDANAPAPVDAP